MRIMCLNGWGGTLHDCLIPYLADADPDVLCLQEVVHSPATDKAELTYRDGDHVLPQRANFFGEVCAALPGHWAMFCPAAEGVLWDGDTTVPSQWGLATFVRRTFPVVGQAQGFVHKDYSSDGYGDHPRSRNAHAVRVFDKAGSRFVTVAHMHGLRDLAGKHDTPKRLAQAERLMALSRQASEPGDTRIICGDFNVEAESETLSLIESAGFTELVTGHGHPGTRTSLYSKPGKFADYMAVTSDLEVVSFEVVREPEVSDHCPLVLTI